MYGNIINVLHLRCSKCMWNNRIMIGCIPFSWCISKLNIIISVYTNHHLDLQTQQNPWYLLFATSYFSKRSPPCSLADLGVEQYVQFELWPVLLIYNKGNINQRVTNEYTFSRNNYAWNTTGLLSIMIYNF